MIEEKMAEIIKLGMLVYRQEDIAKGLARDICKHLGLTDTKAIPIEPPVKPEIADKLKQRIKRYERLKERGFESYADLVDNRNKYDERIRELKLVLKDLQ